MVNELMISYETNGVVHAISPRDFDENMPYTLAEMFIELIDASSSNPEIVIDELFMHYGYGKVKE